MNILFHNPLLKAKFSLLMLTLDQEEILIQTYDITINQYLPFPFNLIIASGDYQ